MHHCESGQRSTKFLHGLRQSQDEVRKAITNTAHAFCYVITPGKEIISQSTLWMGAVCMGSEGQW